MRDCAGLDSSSDDSPELDSAGPGDRGSSLVDSGSLSGDLAGDEAIGNDERRRRVVDSNAVFSDTGLLSGRGVEPLPSRRTVVFSDVFLEAVGRSIGVPSPRGSGESRLAERLTERPDPARWRGAGNASEVGTGDGAAEPLAAAVAFRTCARTCDA